MTISYCVEFLPCLKSTVRYLKNHNNFNNPKARNEVLEQLKDSQ